MKKTGIILCLAIMASIVNAQSVKRYEGTMMLPSDLDQVKGIVNEYQVGGTGYYDYYENSEDERVKHGKFYLKANDKYNISGAYSHGQKIGKWSFDEIINPKQYIKSEHKSLSITYKDDVFNGPCKYTLKTVNNYTYTLNCSFENGIIVGDVTMFADYNQSINSKAVTSELRGNIDENGLLNGIWTVSNKGGIEMTQKKMFYKGALVFVEEQDYSTGERVVCYSAFENMQKAPDFNKINDTIINGQDCIRYNDHIALKVPTHRITISSNMRGASLSVYSIIGRFPDSMAYSELLKRQMDSWKYAYSEKKYQEELLNE